MFLRLRRPITVAIAFAVPLAVLIATVRTSVGFWDTADLQTVAWIAGIPYPTGFPLYVVIGWLWTHALPFASVAARLNLLSAVAIAGGAAMVCAIALLFDVAEVLAIGAGWAFAFSFPIWYRGTYADVHPVGFAVAFAAVVCAVRWAQLADRRALAAAILLAAVAIGVDNTTVLILFGGAIAAFERRPPLRLTALCALGAVAIVCAAYALLPLRSAQLSAAHVDPTLALGIPAGRPFWDDHHPATRDGFISLVGGTAWSPGSSIQRLGSWDTIRATARRYGPHLTTDFPYGLAYVSLLGFAFVVGRRPVAAFGLALTGIVPALFGASYPAEADPGRYAFALYAVCAIGIAVAGDRLARFVPQRARRFAFGAGALVLLAVVGVDVSHGGPFFAQRADLSASLMNDKVVMFTRDGAVIITGWTYATPLAYRAYVESAVGKRIVLCGNVQDYDPALYARWLRTRQVVVVADAPPFVPGFHVNVLALGSPSVYELVR